MQCFRDERRRDVSSGRDPWPGPPASARAVLKRSVERRDMSGFRGTEETIRVMPDVLAFDAAPERRLIQELTCPRKVSGATAVDVRRLLAIA